MRHYEIMLLIHPDQSERARVMMDRYVGIIEGGDGQVHRNEDLGRRMLTYPIAKVQKAHYMLMNVECGQETLDELVGALHFSDAVLRHLVIRRDKAIAEQSALAKAVEREAARENKEYPYDREVAHGRKPPRGGPDAPKEGAQAKAESDVGPKDAQAADEAPAEAEPAGQEEAPAQAPDAAAEDAPAQVAQSDEEEAPAEAEEAEEAEPEAEPEPEPEPEPETGAPDEPAQSPTGDQADSAEEAGEEDK